jgi:membrane protease YdiL (CAAX protease family)
MEMAKGVIELPLIVLFHAGFSVAWISWLAIPINKLGFIFNKIGFSFLFGILLGIGMMSFSSLVCRAVIEILRNVPNSYFPWEVKDWLIMTRSGWLRHYLHTIEALSLPVALSIIFGQICCEEIIFRGVLLHYFLLVKPWVAIISSTVLFMFMQLFHMPTLMSGIFPLIGSMVIGIVNGIFYLKFCNILPLIIAHFSFFVIAVL